MTRDALSWHVFRSGQTPPFRITWPPTHGVTFPLAGGFISFRRCRGSAFFFLTASINSLLLRSSFDDMLARCPLIFSCGPENVPSPFFPLRVPLPFRQPAFSLSDLQLENIRGQDFLSSPEFIPQNTPYFQRGIRLLPKRPRLSFPLPKPGQHPTLSGRPVFFGCSLQIFLCRVPIRTFPTLPPESLFPRGRLFLAWPGPPSAPDFGRLLHFRWATSPSSWKSILLAAPLRSPPLSELDSFGNYVSPKRLILLRGPQVLLLLGPSHAVFREMGNSLDSLSRRGRACHLDSDRPPPLFPFSKLFPFADPQGLLFAGSSPAQPEAEPRSPIRCLRLKFSLSPPFFFGSFRGVKSTVLLNCALPLPWIFRKFQGSIARVAQFPLELLFLFPPQLFPLFFSEKGTFKVSGTPSLANAVPLMKLTEDPARRLPSPFFRVFENPLRSLVLPLPFWHAHASFNASCRREFVVLAPLTAFPFLITPPSPRARSFFIIDRIASRYSQCQSHFSFNLKTMPGTHPPPWVFALRDISFFWLSLPMKRFPLPDVFVELTVLALFAIIV